MRRLKVTITDDQTGEVLDEKRVNIPDEHADCDSINLALSKGTSKFIRTYVGGAMDIGIEDRIKNSANAV